MYWFSAPKSAVCIHFFKKKFLESKRLRHLYNGHVLNGAKLQDSTSCWVGIQPFFSKSCWMECQNQSHSLSRCVRKFLLLKISRGLDITSDLMGQIEDLKSTIFVKTFSFTWRHSIIYYVGIMTIAQTWH